MYRPVGEEEDPTQTDVSYHGQWDITLFCLYKDNSLLYFHVYLHCVYVASQAGLRGSGGPNHGGGLDDPQIVF